MLDNMLENFLPQLLHNVADKDEKKLSLSD